MTRFCGFPQQGIAGVFLHRAVTCPLTSMLSHAHYLPAYAWRFNWHIENKKLFLRYIIVIVQALMKYGFRLKLIINRTNYVQKLF
jgi:hypothetical protein